MVVRSRCAAIDVDVVAVGLSIRVSARSRRLVLMGIISSWQEYDHVVGGVPGAGT
jgi:hypothetical protein